jgi:hypothetical protein
MEQIAIVARLKSGAEPRAAELIAHGPPFDPRGTGLVRHAVYLSADEVVFVFEGKEVEWVLDRLIDEPFQWPVVDALDEWRPLLEDNPRIARSVYSWSAEVLEGAAAASSPS